MDVKKRPRDQGDATPAVAMVAKKPRLEARVRVAIIGTAGRANDARNAQLSAALFERMVDAAAAHMAALGVAPLHAHVISGGAAWADHVAVALFLQRRVAALTLYAPCAYDRARGAYVDTGSGDWRTNPGRTSNYYHRAFAAKVGRDTLAEIGQAIEQGATLDTGGGGFHARNAAIAAKATHLLAFTWSADGTPTDGGTADTWRRCRLPAALKVHLCLGTLDEEAPK